MNELTLPSMNRVAVNKVRSLEAIMLAETTQVDIKISHLLHAGLYSRTAMVPQGVLITGALVKLETLLIISGDVVVYTGDDTVPLTGYNVIPAAKNRKQAFLAQSDVYITMLFPTTATSVQEAEEQFTDEVALLQSRSQ